MPYPRACVICSSFYFAQLTEHRPDEKMHPLTLDKRGEKNESKTISEKNMRKMQNN